MVFSFNFIALKIPKKYIYIKNQIHSIVWVYKAVLYENITSSFNFYTKALYIEKRYFSYFPHTIRIITFTELNTTKMSVT